MMSIGNIGKAQKFVNKLIAKSSDELGDECIPWPFALTNGGYGRLEIEGTTHSHHRAIWILKHGPISEGLVVRHKCKMRSCCNPNHHELGTYKDNVRDKIRDGTNVSGEKSPLSKLTKDQVLDIYSRVASGESRYSVRKNYGLGNCAILSIIEGRTWKHLNLKPLNLPALKAGRYAKLTDAQVIDIHRKYVKGMSAKQLADEYDVTIGIIYHIASGETYKYLKLGKASELRKLRKLR